MKRVALTLILFAAPEAWGDEFFSAKVEPLLRDHCFRCHSHEAGKMKGGLTLDSRRGWESGGDSGPAVVPNKPEESLLVSAVRYEDPELEMPPKKRLSDTEIETLVEWVRRGAPDPRVADLPKPADTEWWSLKKLAAREAPGDGHPIDAFIRSRLAQEGLTPAPRADRVTLARRLYVDLHGYLPTTEEVEAFLERNDHDAFECLVDELLKSPRYGERWARHWLDVIHFADSHGCEHDVKRPNAWRFRDYVIDRLNDDVPWDRFIREQLAPDVFFPEEPQLMAGLGFVAAGPLELSRAGTAPVTFDYLDRDDIVTQTMAAIVSTTANCARCHTHKFDPITQEDYYSLQAVFAGVGKGDIEFDRAPEVMRRRQAMEGLLGAVAAMDAAVLLQPRYSGIVREWVAARKGQPAKWTPLQLDSFVATSGAMLTRQDDGSVFVSGALADEEIYSVTAGMDLSRLAAVRVEALKDERLPKNGPGRAENGNFHLSEVDFHWFAPGADAAVKLEITRASADFDQDGWTSAQAFDGDLKSGWAIFPKVDASHHIVLELAEPIDLQPGGKLTVILKQLWPQKHFIGRFRLSATDAENCVAEVLPANVQEALRKSPEQQTDAERAGIAAVALREYAEKELATLPPKEVVYGVSPSWSHAKKLPQPQEPKVVHLLRRGAFDKPVREVGPGALSLIDALPSRFEVADLKNESLRRAALADWLAHHDNPLTWRSIVNRVWHYHFGRGLCDTPNDFGRMGSEPTHPDLLDWLAVWFRDEAKGSLKQLHRLILTSQTWQQSSRVAPNAKDEDNRLLWRMSRQRIDAEVFRDSVLRIAGRIDLAMGGEGVEQFARRVLGPQSTRQRWTTRSLRLEQPRPPPAGASTASCGEEFPTHLWKRYGLPGSRACSRPNAAFPFPHCSR